MNTTTTNFVQVLRLLSLLLVLVPPVAADDPVRFGRDILPILSSNCFSCHGPDDSVRKAGLRLDLEADARSRHDSGLPVAAGRPDDSVIMQRITSTDPDLVMPPRDSHRELTPAQIAVLRRWIAEGAEWGRHWSFEVVERPTVTVPSGPSAIDVLVAATLQQRGLALRPAAAPQQLVRRLWLDVVGLPPAPETADRFAASPTDAAWEALVDELLASPGFGEHWARLWMDLARYADTKGYEKDLGRTMWPYRDWLVQAINSDMSLDRMTVEQLAGDLLPDATDSQRIATAFHRNTMSNDEGGTDDEEFRSVAVKDRVDTTLQVWMGLTAGCAKCHSHKYDPLSQSEYYSLYAVFNQTQDADRFDDAPTMEIVAPAVEAERTQVNAQISLLKTQLEAAQAAAETGENAGWQFGVVSTATSANGATLTAQQDHSVQVRGAVSAEDIYVVTMTLKSGRHTVLRCEALPERMADGQLGVGRNAKDPNFVLSELDVELLVGDSPRRVMLTDPRADFAQDNWPVQAALDGDSKTGWAVSPRQRERHVAMFTIAEPLTLDADTAIRITIRQHYGDSLTLRRFRFSTTPADPRTVDLPPASPEVRRLTDELATSNAELKELNARIARLPVMSALDAAKQRITRVHRRGNFLDPGDEVTAALPAAFHQMPEDRPVNRLALAEWLMSRENTLTPRVWANRIWARLFGLGLVETEEDFGALGATPMHPELLDWLAVEYRDNGWSLKKFLKTILLSRVYRQSSDLTNELREQDPRNQLLSRGPRFRLSGEVVRDQALAVAGMLSGKMGGPPVMPPQPDGLWRSTYNGLKWVNAEGDDRYRRALYTYLKRTTPYPSMTTFDGGSGEVCQIRRIRTNTPLQALITLNDPVFLEAAAGLARRMVDVPGTERDRASRGLRLALIRSLREGEEDPLVQLQGDVRSAFETQPDDAAALIRSTRASVPAGMSASEFASWIVVASTIMNLDEFLTKN